jgi:hypothetical protein
MLCCMGMGTTTPAYPAHSSPNISSPEPGGAADWLLIFLRQSVSAYSLGAVGAAGAAAGSGGV